MTNRTPRLLTGIGLALVVLAVTPIRASGQAPAPEVTASLHVRRSTLYVGEVFELTLSLRSVGARIGGNLELMGMPDGQTLAIASPFESTKPERTTEGGRTSETQRYRCLLKAMKPERVHLAPVLRTSLLQQERTIIGTTTVQVPRQVPVAPLELEVRDIPTANRPPDFSGAIGSYTFDVAISPTNLAEGDLVTGSLRVRGIGSFDPSHPPRFSAERHFKVYDPKQVVAASKDEYVFEQVLIPQSTNATRIPPVSFSFFDPDLGNYRTLSRGPFHLRFISRVTSTFTPFRPPVEAPVTSEPGTPPQSRPVAGSTPFHRVDLVQGLNIGATLYWILVLGGLTALWKRMRRPWLAGIALLAVALVLFAGLFPLCKRHLTHPFDGIVWQAETARLAPSLNARAVFDIPAGERIRIDEHGPGWLKVEAGPNRGWVPAGSVRVE
jgi:hypothetical protein